MAFFYQKLVIRTINNFKIDRRNLNKIAINEKVLQCFQEIFDLSESQALPILVKHRKLNLLEKKSIVESLKVLNSFNINRSTVLENPSILLIQEKYLINHSKILLECGFPQVKTDILIAYFTLIKKVPIKDLKTCGLLPHNLNIYEKLTDCFTTLSDPTLFQGKYDEENSLLNVRLSVMQKYLEIKLNMQKEVFQKIRKQYFYFQHIPLVNVDQSFLIATEEIKYSTEKILNYPFVVVVDPSNTRKILDDPNSLCGLNVIEQLQKFPAILKAKYSSILEINKILNEFQIPLSTLKRSDFIYSLKPDTVRKRILNSKKNVVFDCFSKNPRFLLLIKYQNRAEKRLSLLRNFNRRCVSLQGLTMPNVAFENYFNSPYDKNNKYDVFRLFEKLSPELEYTESFKKLNSSIKKLKKLLERHSYYTVVPIENIAKTINWCKFHFSNEIVLKNIHLLFYSKDLVETYFFVIKQMVNTNIHNEDNKTFTNTPEIANCLNCEFSIKLKNDINSLKLDLTKLNDCQILSLILYLIEQNHHYSGEGIWDRKT